MTPKERTRHLSPSHDHFELVDDPWHVDAFAGVAPEVQDALAQGRVISIGVEPPRRGVRRKIWYSVDWCGNLIGEWGEDTPPGVEAPR